jgi:hypothetical protein
MQNTSATIATHKIMTDLTLSNPFHENKNPYQNQLLKKY